MIKSEADIIGKIYDAALGLDDWSKVLALIAKRSKSLSAVLITNTSNDNDNTILSHYNIDPYWLDQYHKEYASYDPTIDVVRSNPGRAIADHVTGHDRSNMAKKNSIFYNHVMVPQEFYHTAVCGLAGYDNINDALILQRTKYQASYDEPTLKQFEYISTHLRRALNIKQKLSELDAMARQLTDAFHRLPVGIIMFHYHHITLINDKALEHVRESPLLNVSHSQLIIKSTYHQKELNKLLNAVSGKTNNERLSTGGAVRIDNGSRLVDIVVCPFAASQMNEKLDRQANTLAFLVDPHKKNEYSEILMKQLYGLAPSEARLTNKLCQGYTLEEIATLQGLTMNTVRSKLKLIMRKVGVNKQAELVRVVLTGPIRFYVNNHII